MNCSRVNRWMAATLAVAVAGLPGCSDGRKKTPKVRRVQGIAKTIDLANNDVSMIVRDDRGGERELRGTVRENTEVIINGRAQRLEDVREGDKITVHGYREVDGDRERLVATRVEVTRPRESDWKSTAVPASQPAAPVGAGDSGRPAGS